MTNKKNKKKQQIIVISLGTILCLGFLWFMFSGNDDIKMDRNVETVIDKETGNASHINFSVPFRKDSILIEESLIDGYERIRKDSINKSKVDKISLSNGSTFKAKLPESNTSTANSRLDFSESEVIVKTDPYQNSSDWLKPKSTSKAVEINDYSDNRGSNNSRSFASKSKSNNEETEMEYYKRLVEARKLQLQNSGDISIDNVNESISNNNGNNFESIEVRASVFKNQFVLPGDRVKLVLTEDMVYRGNLFERNTTIYGFVSINKSRVLLDIENINGITIDLKVKDIDDNLEGLYNKSAGELWERFQEENNKNIVGEVSNGINSNNSLVNSTIRSLGSLFKKKRISENDKILLINDHEVILTNLL